MMALLSSAGFGDVKSDCEAALMAARGIGFSVICNAFAVKNLYCICAKTTLTLSITRRSFYLLCLWHTV